MIVEFMNTDTNNQNAVPTEKKIYKLNIFWSGLALTLIVIGIFFFATGLIGMFTPKPTPPKIDPKEETQPNGIELGMTTERVQAATLTASDKAARTTAKIARTGKWMATDYAKGDLKVGSYQVKQGDTLWEIAEAVYGSGFKWKKILAENKSKIGFLKNGSQALIRPGQILTIPE